MWQFSFRFPVISDIYFIKFCIFVLLSSTLLQCWFFHWIWMNLIRIIVPSFFLHFQHSSFFQPAKHEYAIFDGISIGCIHFWGRLSTHQCEAKTYGIYEMYCLAVERTLNRTNGVLEQNWMVNKWCQWYFWIVPMVLPWYYWAQWWFGTSESMVNAIMLPMVHFCKM